MLSSRPMQPVSIAIPPPPSFSNSSSPPSHRHSPISQSPLSYDTRPPTSTVSESIPPRAPSITLRTASPMPIPPEPSDSSDPHGSTNNSSSEQVCYSPLPLLALHCIVFSSFPSTFPSFSIQNFYFLLWCFTSCLCSSVILCYFWPYNLPQY